MLTWVQADTALLACPAHPGSLAITSRTFMAAICDADDPCSVNTASDPESSFTASPRSTTRPVYFGNFGSNSDFLRCHQSAQQNELLLPSLLCLVGDPFLAFHSCHSCHTRYAANFSSKIVVTQRIEHLLSNVIFTISFLCLFDALSEGVVGFNDTCLFRLLDLEAFWCVVRIPLKPEKMPL